MAPWGALGFLLRRAVLLGEEAERVSQSISGVLLGLFSALGLTWAASGSFWVPARPLWAALGSLLGPS